MAYEKGGRPEGGFKRRGPARRRKKVCVFCGKENNEIDYKDVAKLKKYISERDVYKRQGLCAADGLEFGREGTGAFGAGVLCGRPQILGK